MEKICGMDKEEKCGKMQQLWKELEELMTKEEMMNEEKEDDKEPADEKAGTNQEGRKSGGGTGGNPPDIGASSSSKYDKEPADEKAGTNQEGRKSGGGTAGNPPDIGASSSSKFPETERKCLTSKSSQSWKLMMTDDGMTKERERSSRNRKEVFNFTKLEDMIVHYGMTSEEKKDFLNTMIKSLLMKKQAQIKKVENLEEKTRESSRYWSFQLVGIFFEHDDKEPADEKAGTNQEGRKPGGGTGGNPPDIGASSSSEYDKEPADEKAGTNQEGRKSGGGTGGNPPDIGASSSSEYDKEPADEKADTNQEGRKSGGGTAGNPPDIGASSSSKLFNFTKFTKLEDMMTDDGMTKEEKEEFLTEDRDEKLRETLSIKQFLSQLQFIVSKNRTEVLNGMMTQLEDMIDGMTNEEKKCIMQNHISPLNKAVFELEKRLANKVAKQNDEIAKNNLLHHLYDDEQEYKEKISLLDEMYKDEDEYKEKISLLEEMYKDEDEYKEKISLLEEMYKDEDEYKEKISLLEEMYKDEDEYKEKISILDDMYGNDEQEYKEKIRDQQQRQEEELKEERKNNDQLRRQIAEMMQQQQQLQQLMLQQQQQVQRTSSALPTSENENAGQQASGAIIPKGCLNLPYQMFLNIDNFEVTEEIKSVQSVILKIKMATNYGTGDYGEEIEIINQLRVSNFFH
ncbi:uncharacterized protein [Clytia hemisphaerica]|uniref:uncharacterized protein n=1 Tax=Clytia hemisphaerica TaxID=252671 RepID=UPI0034D4BA1A